MNKEGHDPYLVVKKFITIYKYRGVTHKSMIFGFGFQHTNVESIKLGQASSVIRVAHLNLKMQFLTSTATFFSK